MKQKGVLPVDNKIKIKAGLIIFDLDGTLIDSSRDIAWAANETLKAMGYAPMETPEIVAAIGWGVTMLLEQLMPDSGPHAIAKARESFLDFYGGHLTVETTVYPGVMETVSHFAGLGKKMAVVTNKPEGLARRALDELGLGGFFSMVVGGDTLGARKPDPAPLLKVMEGLAHAPSATVMVGDSPVDCEAGRKAGVSTIAVSYGFRPVTELQGAGCTAMVESFAGLREIII